MMRGLMIFHAATRRRVRVLKRSKCLNINYLTSERVSAILAKFEYYAAKRQKLKLSCARLETLIVRRHLIPTRSSPMINLDNWKKSRDENGNQQIMSDKDTNNGNNKHLKTKIKSEENLNGDIKTQQIKKQSNPIISTKINPETQNLPRHIQIEKRETTAFVGFSSYQSQRLRKRNKNLRLRIAVMGEKGVGKSSIMKTLLKSKIRNISQNKSYTEYSAKETYLNLDHHVNIIEFKGLYEL